MSARRDCLAECNDQGVALEDFKNTFCVRCYQPECTRSLFGQMKFEQRVLSWEERLFKAPPKMDKKDPRYLPLAQADFRTISVDKPTQVSVPQWLDPNDIPATPVEEPIEEAPATEPTPLVIPEDNGKVEEVEVQNTTPPVAPVEPSGVKVVPKHLLLMNTPPQPQMLPGASVQKPAVDPWAGPAPQTDEKASVVKRGAKIKMGG